MIKTTLKKEMKSLMSIKQEKNRINESIFFLISKLSSLEIW